MKFNLLTKTYALITEHNKELKSFSGIILNVNGSFFYFQNGMLHNESGPAIRYTDGTKEWFINGLRHRLDGPAVEWKDEKEWFIEGKMYSEEEHHEKIKEMNLINEI